MKTKLVSTFPNGAEVHVLVDEPKSKSRDKYLTAGDQIRLQKLILFVARSSISEFSTGGCTPFYSAKQWKDKGEEYGLSSKLIVCHDGGDLAYFFNWNYGAYESIEKMRKALELAGYYAEQCTGWYTAIYKL